MSALFAEVLVKPLFLWGFNTLGYVFTGQIATAVAVPIVCGYFSDQITKLLRETTASVRYPQRVDGTLVLICSCRGFIGFGISYGPIAFVDKMGYDGAFNIFAGIMGALMVIGIFIYIFGTQIRRRTQRFVVGS
ncbi:hypothetical protein BDV27DRAFT_158646 [Aspergillus caelatus]|uniref:Major facilitator superfamily domain-containing protein n=1 Tax=Aspergillus caelatus TaxID=61420 RepID=A0A5N7A363_9EURO|nr:uncharacterized protein BDV27DRAFT_158646 [Aspergillus caelatus]KAE8363629.1 hypothetical protein BDV27DRAFT_158646 [Aspergillus caelatus]